MRNGLVSNLQGFFLGCGGGTDSPLHGRWHSGQTGFYSSRHGLAAGHCSFPTPTFFFPRLYPSSIYRVISLVDLSQARCWAILLGLRTRLAARESGCRGITWRLGLGRGRRVRFVYGARCLVPKLLSTPVHMRIRTIEHSAVQSPRRQAQCCPDV
ncbi:hypothetical protein VTK73DRAFT_721 [Phialemonium thermophilum]|uniref:Uncharacterized protein n=1 Tax=Phialemonium thermophilum TaxID=223376 RepID=A0ABR3VUE6_9PEZI